MVRILDWEVSVFLRMLLLAGRKSTKSGYTERLTEVKPPSETQRVLLMIFLNYIKDIDCQIVNTDKLLIYYHNFDRSDLKVKYSRTSWESEAHSPELICSYLKHKYLKTVSKDILLVFFKGSVISLNTILVTHLETLLSVYNNRMYVRQIQNKLECQFKS